MGRVKETEGPSGTADALRRLPPRRDGSRGGLGARGTPASGSGIQTRRRATRATASKTRVTASSQLQAQVVQEAVAARLVLKPARCIDSK